MADGTEDYSLFETDNPKERLALLNFSFTRRLPLLRQSEAAECGLACLAMVAGFHGSHADINSLRRRFPISLKGANLVGLMEIAGRI